MNIIEYSFRLGKALNKTEIGKKMKSTYVSLKEKYEKCETEETISHYQVYDQCVASECSRNHFYGWFVIYEKMKQYVEDEVQDREEIILNAAEYILKSDDFKIMSDVSQEMGSLVVKLVDSIICSEYDDADIQKLLKVMKVKNAVTDLQMSIERTGIKMFLAKNAKAFFKYDSKYEMELKRNNYIPYIGEEKPISCARENSESYMDLLDRMIFIQYVMLMGIFEGFWNILIELSDTDGVESYMNQPNGIRRTSFVHKNIEKELLNREAWMYKIYVNKDHFYFLANKRFIHIENNEGTSEVYGVCYPKEDMGLFEKEVVTEL